MFFVLLNYSLYIRQNIQISRQQCVVLENLLLDFIRVRDGHKKNRLSVNLKSASAHEKKGVHVQEHQ